MQRIACSFLLLAAACGSSTRVIPPTTSEAIAPLMPDQAGVLEDPHLAARGYFQAVEQPEAGTFPIKTRPMKFSRTDGTIHTPAPALGQHNRYILGGLLGLSDERIAELESLGVIGSEPASRGPRE